MQTRDGVFALGWWALSSMDESSILAGRGRCNWRAGGGCYAANGALKCVATTSTPKRRWLRAGRGTLQMHGFGDYVGVFEA